MSRQIDISKKLSEEDLAYLDSRGRHDLIEQNARVMAAQAQDQGPEQVDDGNTGDVDPFKKDDGTDLLAGTHPGETPVNPIQSVEAQGISDLDDQDKNPDGVVPGVPEPSRQAGDGEGEQPAEGSDAVGPRTTGDDEDGDNYDDEDVWSYADLKEEVKGRESIDIPLNSKREELIAALRADDES